MGEEKVTNSKTIEVGNHVHFSSFAVLLEKIAKIDEATNIKGKIEEKKRLVQQFLELWRDKAKQLKNSCKEGETVNESFLPIMRFLLPDIAGRVYGLKENKLANYLIEVLSISKNSTDGKKLLNYRVYKIILKLPLGKFKSYFYLNRHLKMQNLTEISLV